MGARCMHHRSIGEAKAQPVRLTREVDLDLDLDEILEIMLRRAVDRWEGNELLCM